MNNFSLLTYRIIFLLLTCFSFSFASSQESPESSHHLTQIYYVYDEYSRVKEKVAPGFFHYRVEFDSENNIVRMDDFLQNETIYRTYDSDNRLIKEILGNGITLHYTYDTQDRLTDLQINTEDFTGSFEELRFPEATFRADFQKQVFTYDPLNRIIEIVTPDTKIVYTYDGFDRKSSRNIWKRSPLNQEWKFVRKEFLLPSFDESQNSSLPTQVTHLQVNVEIAESQPVESAPIKEAAKQNARDNQWKQRHPGKRNEWQRFVDRLDGSRRREKKKLKKEQKKATSTEQHSTQK